MSDIFFYNWSRIFCFHRINLCPLSPTFNKPEVINRKYPSLWPNQEKICLDYFWLWNRDFCDIKIEQFPLIWVHRYILPLLDLPKLDPGLFFMFILFRIRAMSKVDDVIVPRSIVNQIIDTSPMGWQQGQSWGSKNVPSRVIKCFHGHQ